MSFYIWHVSRHGRAHGPASSVPGNRENLETSSRRSSHAQQFVWRKNRGYRTLQAGGKGRPCYQRFRLYLYLDNPRYHLYIPAAVKRRGGESAGGSILFLGTSHKFSLRLSRINRAGLDLPVANG